MNIKTRSYCNLESAEKYFGMPNAFFMNRCIPWNVWKKIWL